MKTSMSLETALDTARAIEKRAVDYIAPVGRLSMQHHFEPANYPHGRTGYHPDDSATFPVLQLDAPNGEINGELTDSAFSQLCSHLMIPHQYAARLRDNSIPAEVGDEWVLNTGRGMVTKLSREAYPKATPLLAAMVNHALSHGDQNGYRMLRGLLPVGKGTQQWRAILSNQYLPIPSVSVLDQAMLHCNKVREATGNEAVLKSADVSEDRLYAKFIFPGMVSRALKTKRVGDIVNIGFVLFNNEIGSGRYGVRGFAEFLTCTNGIILPKWGSGISKVHRTGRIEMDGDIVVSSSTRRAQIAAALAELGDMIDTVTTPERLEFLSRAIEHAADAPEVKTERAENAVKRIAKTELLTEVESKAVYAAFLRGNDFGQFGMSQAICSHDVAQVLSFDRATHLETVAGKVLTMARNDWSRLAMAA